MEYVSIYTVYIYNYTDLHKNEYGNYPLLSNKYCSVII